MPVDGKLLKLLCCPVSKTPLTRLTASQFAHLNDAIAAGGVRTVNGEPVTAILEEGLVTEDRKVVYPVEDGIPVLLEERGIGTTQLLDF